MDELDAANQEYKLAKARFKKAKAERIVACHKRNEGHFEKKAEELQVRLQKQVELLSDDRALLQELKRELGQIRSEGGSIVRAFLSLMERIDGQIDKHTNFRGR